MNNIRFRLSLAASSLLSLLLIYELIAELGRGMPFDILLLVRVVLALALVLITVISRKNYLEKPNS